MFGSCDYHMTEQAWLCGGLPWSLFPTSFSELIEDLDDLEDLDALVALDALLAKDTTVATALKLATSECIISFTCVTYAGVHMISMSHV